MHITQHYLLKSSSRVSTLDKTPIAPVEGVSLTGISSQCWRKYLDMVTISHFSKFQNCDLEEKIFMVTFIDRLSKKWLFGSNSNVNFPFDVGATAFCYIISDK